MNRKILFFPAWDKTPGGGVGDLEMCFQVDGNRGIVEFQLSTNWYVEPTVDRRLQDMKRDVLTGTEDFLLKHFWSGPHPLDLCYFSPVRQSEDDSYWENGNFHHCPNIAPCYYGYKFMDEKEGKMAKDVAYFNLVSKGDEALWAYLEDYYIETFGEENA